jgi:hypothetical protein
VLALFSTTGWIFGPAILLAGSVALFLCVRASLSPRPHRARRAALVSLLPLAVSVCGALVGLGLILTLAGGLSAVPRSSWLALGQCCLAGLVVTALPLLWSLVLLCLRGGA